MVFAFILKRGEDLKSGKTKSSLKRFVEQARSILCKAKRGHWGQGFVLNEYSCDFWTSDSGKECSDSSECIGACISLNISQEDKDKLEQGEVVYTKGTCSRWKEKKAGNCNFLVTQGKIDLGKYYCGPSE